MEQTKILTETYTLANGVKIPKMGLVTWFIPDHETAKSVCSAVKMGYRHIDTAQAYENERGVGEGVRSCGVARESLFVTTKLAAEVKAYNERDTEVYGGVGNNTTTLCSGKNKIHVKPRDTTTKYFYDPKVKDPAAS